MASFFTRMKNISAFVCFLVPFCVFSQPFNPVNPNADAKTASLLSYLYQINGKFILSGQHGGGNRFIDSVRAIAGKRPALWGSDFIWHGSKDEGQKVVDEAIEKNREGYLVTLMWHQGRPTDNPPYGWKESIQGKLTDEQWQQLITPNTELNKKWLAQIDVVASYLKQLQQAGVPVLWRPYHEMNGVWFWWGNRPGKNGVIRLWKMMYNRYVNYHHLNNLLWVWGANGPRDIPLDEAYAYRDFYPGAKYVDVLGADVYHSDYEQKDYNELLKLARGKIIALTEVGELPKSEILKAQPKWAWFLVWTDFLWNNNSQTSVKEIYAMPETISHTGKNLF
jgi:mannan endo-1,4-beta-mannosidase